MNELNRIFASPEKLLIYRESFKNTSNNERSFNYSSDCSAIYKNLLPYELWMKMKDDYFIISSMYCVSRALSDGSTGRSRMVHQEITYDETNNLTYIVYANIDVNNNSKYGVSFVPGGINLCANSSFEIAYFLELAKKIKEVNYV